MSHIFISYSRKNIDIRDRLIKFLMDNDIDEHEIWFDKKNIAAGEQWIPQIDDALDEAYALIVIVTPDSMQSTYVTYEWSSALGSGIPVFPLLFEGKFDDFHTRLLQEQALDCRKIVPSTLIDDLISKRATPPEIDFLNWKISEIMMRPRVAVLVTHWFFAHIKENADDNSRFVGLEQGMLDEIRDAYSIHLPEFIISTAPSMTRRQLSMGRKLITNLRDYWQIFMMSSGDSTFHLNDAPKNAAPRAIVFWDRNLFPLVDFFRTRHPYEEAFDTLANHLLELSGKPSNQNPHLLLGPTEIIDWLFDKEEKYGQLLKGTIQRVRDRKE